MTVQRQSIIRGPATVKLGTGPVFYDKDGVDLIFEVDRFNIDTSAFGNVDERLNDTIARCTFTPAGEVSAADMALLYPYQSPTIGDSIFGNTDVPLEVHSVAGTKVTIPAGAITGMPDMMLSAGKTVFGAAEIMGIIKDNTARSVANSVFDVSAVAFADTSFATANVKTVTYVGVFGSILPSIVTEDGWTVTFDVGIVEHQVDDVGTIDATLESVGLLAKCKPINLSESDVLGALSIQGTGVARGATRRTGVDLVITGAGSAVVLKINDAAMVEGPLRWGSAELRVGEIGFIGHRKETVGAFTDLFTVTP